MREAASIEGLTIAQKLQLMETIWEDLCRSGVEIPAPEWHGQVLQGRDQQVRAGEAKFDDWDAAKARLRKNTR